MEETLIRHIIYSDEFEEYYASMNEQLKKKYDYALQIVKSQYVVSSKIVKSLENTDFYELRISISSNEYRTILLAVDHDNFIQSKNVLLLNSFLKKDTKQYKAEIGILAVPVEHAQESADLLVANGLRAIWNFTPFRIKVADNVVIQNTSIYAHLAVMYNRINGNK